MNRKIQQGYGLRLGVNELSVNKRLQPENVVNTTYPFCLSVLEDESHFQFNCPLYADFSSKYVTDFIALLLMFFVSAFIINVSVLHEYTLWSFICSQKRK